MKQLLVVIMLLVSATTMAQTASQVIDHLSTLKEDREFTKINYLQDEALAKSIGLPKTYTGKGVLVAVIDAMPDYDHIAFLNPETKQTRIKYMYFPDTDQLFTPDTYSKISFSLKDRFHDSHHGDHTTGIAAGCYNGEVGLAGIATSADIFSCVTKTDFPGALKKIRHIADSLDVPCAVNLSATWGKNLSIFAETDTLIDRVLYEFNDGGKAPGRILCVSAGNNGTYEGLSVIKHTFESDNDTIKVRGSVVQSWWDYSGKENAFTALCSDIESTHAFVEVVDTTTNRPVNDFTFTTDEGDTLTESSQLTAYIIKLTDAKGKNFYKLNLPNLSNDNFNLAVCYCFTGKKGETVTMWSSNNTEVQPEGFTQYNSYLPYTDIQQKSLSPSVISAGAIVSKDCYESNVRGIVHKGDIWEYSAWAQDEDGNIYPDVCAPGIVILSAGLYNKSGEYIVENPTDTTKNYKYIYATGTSMAAPFLTGVAALLLEQDPTLNVERFRQLLWESNDQVDNDVTSCGYKRSGHGVLNAKNLMLRLIDQTTAIKNVNQNTDDEDLAPRKHIENGHLVISKSGHDYNAVGVRVK